MKGRTKEKAKKNLKGKARELGKFDKIFTNNLVDEKLTETQQQLYDRYLTIISYRRAGFSGRYLTRVLKDDKKGLFANLSDSRLNSLIYECVKQHAKLNQIAKQGERLLLAEEFDEMALQAKKEKDYKNWSDLKKEAAKLRGLYLDGEGEEKLPPPINQLSSGAKAEDNLKNNMEFVEGQVEEYEATNIY